MVNFSKPCSGKFSVRDRICFRLSQIEVKVDHSSCSFAKLKRGTAYVDFKFADRFYHHGEPLAGRTAKSSGAWSSQDDNRSITSCTRVFLDRNAGVFLFVY